MEPSVDDARLIEGSLSDPELFAGLYDRHASALGAYLVRRVGLSEGETLLGELFRIAFEHRDRYRPDRADARPWLYGIAANLVMKHFRTAGRHRRAVDRLGTRRDAVLPFDERIATEMAASEQWRRVAAAIDALPERDREVVLLYAWEELSYAEIAEALDIPTGTVRSRLNRARAALRELVVGNGEEPGVQALGARRGVTR